MCKRSMFFKFFIRFKSQKAEFATKQMSYRMNFQMILASESFMTNITNKSLFSTVRHPMSFEVSIALCFIRTFRTNNEIFAFIGTYICIQKNVLY